MPRFVRRQPLSERLGAYLNPYDWMLSTSEWLETSGWDQLEKEWAIPIGISLNFIFLVARANTGRKPLHYDDVFGDVPGVPWGSRLVCSSSSDRTYTNGHQASVFVVLLATFSILNALYTFYRKKHYRLFENPVDAVPSTPSAKRVRVDSSPVSSSPLRFLASMLGPESAESRAHPDSTRDVWEVAVWDPLPVSLRLSCYFSPGHVLIYCLFLPTTNFDPRPSVTIVTTIVLVLLVSVQLSLLQSSYSTQSKDTSYISKEVLHEYDTKYVRPRTQALYRDVGTQFNEQASYSTTRDDQYNKVETYTPAYVINRGFKTNPNANYSSQYDPDGTESGGHHLRYRASTPDFRSPVPAREPGSALRPLNAIRQPSFRPTSSGGDGGNLGVYSHAASPLRKSTSTNFGRNVNGSAHDRLMSPEKGSASPDKRMSVPAGGINTLATSQKWGHLKPDTKHRRESGRF
jgi:hypothetical protein